VPSSRNMSAWRKPSGRAPAERVEGYIVNDEELAQDDEEFSDGEEDFDLVSGANSIKKERVFKRKGEQRNLQCLTQYQQISTGFKS